MHSHLPLKGARPCWALLAVALPPQVVWPRPLSWCFILQEAVIPILDFPSETQPCSLVRAGHTARKAAQRILGQTSRDTDHAKGRLHCDDSDLLSNIRLGLFSQLHTPRIHYARWRLICLLGSSAYRVALICSASQGAVLGKGWSKAETLSEGGS